MSSQPVAAAVSKVSEGTPQKLAMSGQKVVGSGQKVTVVKAADGRIIVKSSETTAVERMGTKLLATVPSPPKSVVEIKTPGQASTPAGSFYGGKEGDGRRDSLTGGKKDDATPVKISSAKDPRKVSHCYISEKNGYTLQPYGDTASDGHLATN